MAKLGKQLAMFVWVFLSLQNINENVLYQVAKGVAYLARGCISHAVVERDPQQQGQKRGFLLPVMGSTRPWLLQYTLCCFSRSLPAQSHSNEPLKQLLGENEHMSVDGLSV